MSDEKLTAKEAAEQIRAGTASLETLRRVAAAARDGKPFPLR